MQSLVIQYYRTRLPLFLRPGLAVLRGKVRVIGPLVSLLRWCCAVLIPATVLEIAGRSRGRTANGTVRIAGPYDDGREQRLSKVVESRDESFAG